MKFFKALRVRQIASHSKKQYCLKIRNWSGLQVRNFKLPQS